MKQFPPFRLDTVDERLWRGESKLTITPKAFAVLRYLVEHPGRLVTQDELLDALWPETYVQPQVLRTYVLEIRKVLRDDPKTPLFVETHPKRGYRFIASVVDVAAFPVEAVASAKIVGRDRELAELQKQLQQALRGQRQIVFITGEPGIGKTALVDAFSEKAAQGGVRIARGQCVERSGSQEPYYPVLEAVADLCRGPERERVLAGLGTTAPTWLVQFPSLVSDQQREKLIREIQGATAERMLREICELLETLTSANGLLFILEDVHWADHATVDLLSAWARRRAAARVLLIATYRPVDAAVAAHPVQRLKQELLLGRHCQELAVDLLNRADVSEYLVKALQPNLPAEFPSLVYEHSEGNPLFMEAVLDYFRREGLLRLENGAWRFEGAPRTEFTIPQDLGRMVELQLEQLTPTEQLVLEAGSLVGVSFPAWAPATALEFDLDVVESHCDQLARRFQFVRAGGIEELPDGTKSKSYAFAHSLYREVLQARQSPARRAKLHLSIARRLEHLFAGREAEVAATLAGHFEQGFDWARTIRYLELAADNALSRCAHAEAIHILRHCLELVQKTVGDERRRFEVELLQKLGSIYRGLSHHSETIEVFQSLADKAGSYGLASVQAIALIRLALPLAAISRERGLQAVDEALTLAPALDDELARARVRMRGSFLRIWIGGWNPTDVQICRSCLDEIRAAGDRSAYALHSADYSFLQYAMSQYRDSYQTAEESLPVLVELGETREFLTLQVYMTWQLMFLGEWGMAAKTLDSAEMMAQRNGNHSRAQALRIFKSWLHLHALDFEGARRIAQAELTLIRKDWPYGITPRLALLFSGLAELGLGNFQAASALLNEYKGLMSGQRVNTDWYWHMPLAMGLTELALASGDLNRARVQSQEFLRVVEETQERTWKALAWDASARIALAGEDWALANDEISKAIAAMEGFETPLAAWRVHGTAARLSERLGDTVLRARHRERSVATVRRVADSLDEKAPLRQSFLSSPLVSSILEGA
jgi:DNA-binding winged helix-turn-helix (wHTH) protein/tetratricopeptide (TPR) repeat protein